MQKSHLEERLLVALRASGFAEPVRSFRFCEPLRKLEIDFAWPERKLGIEVQGGTWKRTRAAHSWGPGQRRDADKLNIAALLRWTLLYCTADMLREGSMEDFLSLFREVYEGRSIDGTGGCEKDGGEVDRSDRLAEGRQEPVD